MYGLSEAARFELEELREAAGGALIPVAVVDRARSENSALHRYFEWSDDVAAEAYRIQQARGVIRAVVKMMPAAGGHPVRVRAYVSLPSERATHGGYRAVGELVEDEARIAEVLRAFQRDIEGIRSKYGAWAHLRPAIDHLAQTPTLTPARSDANAR